MSTRQEEYKSGKGPVVSDQEKQPLTTEHLPLTTEIIKQIIIPEIEREVNKGKTFANLRQIYNASILATWFKQNLKESVLGQIYVDQGKTKGVDVKDAQQQRDEIYQQYVAAFQKGAFDLIKEEYDPVTQTIIPRKYFSGGAVMGAKGVLKTDDGAMHGASQQDIRRRLNALDGPFAAKSWIKVSASLEGLTQNSNGSIGPLSSLSAGMSDGKSLWSILKRKLGVKDNQSSISLSSKKTSSPDRISADMRRSFGRYVEYRRSLFVNQRIKSGSEQNIIQPLRALVAFHGVHGPMPSLFNSPDERFSKIAINGLKTGEEARATNMKTISFQVGTFDDTYVNSSKTNQFMIMVPITRIFSEKYGYEFWGNDVGKLIQYPKEMQHYDMFGYGKNEFSFTGFEIKVATKKGGGSPVIDPKYMIYLVHEQSIEGVENNIRKQLQEMSAADVEAEMDIIKKRMFVFNFSQLGSDIPENEIDLAIGWLMDTPEGREEFKKLSGGLDLLELSQIVNEAYLRDRFVESQIYGRLEFKGWDSKVEKLLIDQRKEVQQSETAKKDQDLAMQSKDREAFLAWAQGEMYQSLNRIYDRNSVDLSYEKEFNGVPALPKVLDAMAVDVHQGKLFVHFHLDKLTFEFGVEDLPTVDEIQGKSDDEIMAMIDIPEDEVYVSLFEITKHDVMIKLKPMTDKDEKLQLLSSTLIQTAKQKIAADLATVWEAINQAPENFFEENEGVFKHRAVEEVGVAQLPAFGLKKSSNNALLVTNIEPQTQAVLDYLDAIDFSNNEVALQKLNVIVADIFPKTSVDKKREIYFDGVKTTDEFLVIYRKLKEIWMMHNLRADDLFGSLSEWLAIASLSTNNADALEKNVELLHQAYVLMPEMGNIISYQTLLIASHMRANYLHDPESGFIDVQLIANQLSILIDYYNRSKDESVLDNIVQIYDPHFYVDGSETVLYLADFVDTIPKKYLIKYFSTDELKNGDIKLEDALISDFRRDYLVDKLTQHQIDNQTHLSILYAIKRKLKDVHLSTLLRAKYAIAVTSGPRDAKDTRKYLRDPDFLVPEGSFIERMKKYTQYLNQDIKTLEDRIRERSSSEAQGEKKGGIDLNPAMMNLKSNGRIKLLKLPKLTPQEIQKLNIEGLYPVIINISPITNIPQLLGIKEDEEIEVESAKVYL